MLCFVYQAQARISPEGSLLVLLLPDSRVHLHGGPQDERFTACPWLAISGCSERHSHGFVLGPYSLSIHQNVPMLCYVTSSCRVTTCRAQHVMPSIRPMKNNKVKQGSHCSTVRVLPGGGSGSSVVELRGCLRPRLLDPGPAAGSWQPCQAWQHLP